MIEVNRDEFPVANLRLPRSLDAQSLSLLLGLPCGEATTPLDAFIQSAPVEGEVCESSGSEDCLL